MHHREVAYRTEDGCRRLGHGVNLRLRQRVEIVGVDLQPHEDVGVLVSPVGREEAEFLIRLCPDLDMLDRFRELNEVPFVEQSADSVCLRRPHGAHYRASGDAVIGRAVWRPADLSRVARDAHHRRATASTSTTDPAYGQGTG